MCAPPKRWRGASASTERVSYRQASALALPFEAGMFDGAYMMHVGMNIEDKPALFARCGGFSSQRRVRDLRRDANGRGRAALSVAWAPTAEMSFVAGAAEYRAALEAAGFEIVKERDRGRIRSRILAQGRGAPPPMAGRRRSASTS